MQKAHAKSTCKKSKTGQAKIRLGVAELKLKQSTEHRLQEQKFWQLTLLTREKRVAAMTSLVSVGFSPETATATAAATLPSPSPVQAMSPAVKDSEFNEIIEILDSLSPPTVPRTVATKPKVRAYLLSGLRVHGAVAAVLWQLTMLTCGGACRNNRL